MSGFGIASGVILATVYGWGAVVFLRRFVLKQTEQPFLVWLIGVVWAYDCFCILARSLRV